MEGDGWRLSGRGMGFDEGVVAKEVQRGRGEGMKGVRRCGNQRRVGVQQPETRSEDPSGAEEGYTEGKE